MFRQKNNSSNYIFQNYLKTNLAFLIKKYNFDNESLAKCTGLATATIASLRTRATNPTIATLQPLAEIFGISIDQLISQDCRIDIEQKTFDSSISILSVPIIDLKNVPTWPHKFTAEQYIVTNNNISNACYAIQLSTEILAPMYQKHTVLILDSERVPEDSNIVLLSLNNSELTFRQVFIDAGQFYFKPINQQFGGLQMVQEYKIYGVVVRAIYDLVNNINSGK